MAPNTSLPYSCIGKPFICIGRCNSPESVVAYRATVSTVNLEICVVKIFSQLMAATKNKCIHMCIININVVITTITRKLSH